MSKVNLDMGEELLVKMNYSNNLYNIYDLKME